MSNPDPFASASLDPQRVPTTAATSPAPPKNSAQSGQLDPDYIFGPDGRLKSESWGPAHWLKDNSGYTTLEVSDDFKNFEGAKEIKDIPGPGGATFSCPPQT